MTITAERLRDALDYDLETGAFRWRHSSGARKAGDIAGSVDQFGSGAGRITICIGKRNYRAHRLAWLWVHGVLPDRYIDHINGNPGDNRICNLRLASNAENCRNRKARAGTVAGLKGVRFIATTGRWNARIWSGGRRIDLGMFATAEEAHTRYAAAARQYFGEFARAA